MSGHVMEIHEEGRLGTWVYCSCAWRSGTYARTTGAVLAFGRHLGDVEVES